MKKKSKRIQKIQNVVGNYLYSLSAAISLAKKIATANFNETMEAHFNLQIDLIRSAHSLKGDLSFINLMKKKIAVFTEPEKKKKAARLGAYIADKSLILNKIKTNTIDFDILLATPADMPILEQYSTNLGIIYPSIKTGTLTKNLFQTLKSLNKENIQYKADKSGIVHIAFGKSTMSQEILLNNLQEAIFTIEKNKPDNLSGKYIKSLFISPTMGSSVQIDLSTLK